MTHRETIRQALSPQQSVEKAAELMNAELAGIDRLLLKAERRAKAKGNEFSPWDFLASLYGLNGFDLTPASFLSPLEQLAFDKVAHYADGSQVEPVGDLDFYVLTLHREDLDGSADGEVKVPLTSVVALFDQAWKESKERQESVLARLLSEEVARRVGLEVE